MEALGMRLYVGDQELSLPFWNALAIMLVEVCLFFFFFLNKGLSLFGASLVFLFLLQLYHFLKFVTTDA